MSQEMKGWLFLSGIIVLLAAMVSSAVIVATVLAFLIMAGLITTWLKFPRWLKLFFTAWGIRWVVDAAISFAVPLLMLRTLTGMMAGVILGLMVTACLEIEGARLRAPQPKQVKR